MLTLADCRMGRVHGSPALVKLRVLPGRLQTIAPPRATSIALAERGWTARQCTALKQPSADTRRAFSLAATHRRRCAGARVLAQHAGRGGAGGERPGRVQEPPAAVGTHQKGVGLLAVPPRKGLMPTCKSPSGPSKPLALARARLPARVCRETQPAALPHQASMRPERQPLARSSAKPIEWRLAD